MSAATQARLQAAYDDMATTLALEQAYCAAHGPKPSYSLDGESYQWSEWEEATIRKLEALKKLIQLEGGPYVIQSRARV